MPEVLIALDDKAGDYFSFPAPLVEALARRCPNDRVAFVPTESLEERIGDARALLAWQFPPEALAQATRLRFLMYAADGLGPKRLYPALIQSSVQVTNSRGVRASAMAEHALGSLLGLSRRLFEARDFQRRRHWGKEELITGRLPGEIAEQTVVVVGLGEVGSRVARLLAGLSARVVGVRARPERDGADLVFGPDKMQQALRGASAVILALPPTAHTTKLLDAAAIAALRPGAFVVNVGRGGSLDEEALLRGLRSGHLAGAALDVFAEEPLPETSPLWEMPEVFITPHSSGVTPELWPRVAAIFGENLERDAAGRPLLNLVDKERGY
jgi:phosphoglycerate dehydrogenase-like enzyme